MSPQSKATAIKVIGTIASGIAGGGAAFVPEPYRVIVVGIAGLILGWLHLPQPGAQKAVS